MGGSGRSRAGPVLPRGQQVRHGLQRGVGIRVRGGWSPSHTMPWAPSAHPALCRCLVCACGAGAPAGSPGVGGCAGVRGRPPWIEGALFLRLVGEPGWALTKSHLCLGDVPPACRNSPLHPGGSASRHPSPSRRRQPHPCLPCRAPLVLGQLTPSLLLGGPRGPCCRPVQARGHFLRLGPEEPSLPGSPSSHPGAPAGLCHCALVGVSRADWSGSPPPHTPLPPNHGPLPAPLTCSSCGPGHTGPRPSTYCPSMHEVTCGPPACQAPGHPPDRWTGPFWKQLSVFCECH